MGKRVFTAASAIFAVGLIGCVESDQVNESSTHQNVLTNCSSYPPAGIVPEKEMLIRDLSVVEDTCRTSWTATGCAAGTLGAWTFGQLMTVMSGATDPNSAVARNFVGKWLNFWLTPQTVSPDPTPVAARTRIRTVFLNRWLTDSGCSSTLTDISACTTLDLKQAPLRLLAIVNRLDMDGRDYSGNGAPGELRFVFGVFNKDAVPPAGDPPNPPVNATVILEYKVPSTMPPIFWASYWQNLRSLSFGPSFSNQLQFITDMVVGPNAQPGNPNNGSSIGQIRTNENAFDASAPSLKKWEFRQFALPCGPGTTCLLAQVPVSQTPPTSLNESSSLTSYLVANQAAAATASHVVPNSMLAGSSLSLPGTLPGANAVLWNTTVDLGTGFHTLVNPGDAPLSYAVRHNFAFTTCNGCHYLETANQNQQFHISPRKTGYVAPISPFLTRTLASATGVSPMDYLEVADPNPESYDDINGIPTAFVYNEIWRRACELTRVWYGVPTPFTTATGH